MGERKYLDGAGLGHLWRKIREAYASVETSVGRLKALAFKNSASAIYTPYGTINMDAYVPAGTITTGAGSVNYVPRGAISVPEISVVPTVTTISGITDVGTLPSWDAVVTGETLRFMFSAGTLPIKGANTTVVTGIQKATATRPEFTGTGVNLAFYGTAAAPTGTFNGTQETITVT